MNPLKRMRMEKGLSVKEFALLTGISGPRIRQLERGETFKLPPSVLDTLEQLGFDPVAAREEYEAWLECERATVARKLMARVK